MRDIISHAWYRRLREGSNRTNVFTFFVALLCGESHTPLVIFDSLASSVSEELADIVFLCTVPSWCRRNNFLWLLSLIRRWVKSRCSLKGASCVRSTSNSMTLVNNATHAATNQVRAGWEAPRVVPPLQLFHSLSLHVTLIWSWRCLHTKPSCREKSLHFLASNAPPSSPGPSTQM